MTAAAPEVLRQIPSLRIIHQTGEREYNDVQAAYAQAGVKAEVSAFIDDMPRAFAQADLLLCRSGASTVAEITAAGKPAIFVPFPQAADDHQRRNAEAIAEKGAAVLVPQADLTPEKLAQLLVELFGDPARLLKMSERARALSHPDAAGHVARMVAELGGGIG
jgi:UDP-N-acetylglucosamine--N-acetylmuramyl-(pentapeptide) pyrophosphoryl-undecaprenol N-acetylglucosamine transferase